MAKGSRERDSRSAVTLTSLLSMTPARAPDDVGARTAPLFLFGRGGPDYSGATQAFTDIGDAVATAVPMMLGNPSTHGMSPVYCVAVLHWKPCCHR